MNSERPIIRNLERSGVDVALELLNYPWPITETNAKRQYAISRQMLSAVKLELIASFACITWSMIGTALGRRQGLGLGFIMVEPPLLFAIIGFYLFKAKRSR